MNFHDWKILFRQCFKNICIGKHHTVDGSEIRRENQLRLVVYSIIYKVFIDLRWFSRPNSRKRDVNPRTTEVPEPRIPRSQLTPRGTLVSSLHPETHRLLAWRNRLPQMMGLTSLASNLGWSLPGDGDEVFFSFLKVACPMCAFVLFCVLPAFCVVCKDTKPVWC